MYVSFTTKVILRRLWTGSVDENDISNEEK